jgi:hypothetical protein
LGPRLACQIVGHLPVDRPDRLQAAAGRRRLQKLHHAVAAGADLVTDVEQALCLPEVDVASKRKVDRVVRLGGVLVAVSHRGGERREPCRHADERAAQAAQGADGAEAGHRDARQGARGGTGPADARHLPADAGHGGIELAG